MMGKLHSYLAKDHRRLEELLKRSNADPEHIDMESYGQFRVGLLRHIGWEEKILLPTVQKLRHGEPLPIAAKLRLDHGAIAALLVLPPSGDIIAALWAILQQHDRLEEMNGGAYEECENIVGPELDALIDRMRHAPEVPANPFNPGRQALDAAKRALARAGYNLDDYISPGH